MNNLTLENFRTYKDKVSIDLAPITILTGKNNAGKSTVFKALLLLSDYLNSNNHMILEFDGPSSYKHKVDRIDNALTWGSSSKSFKIEYTKDDYLFSFTFGNEDNNAVLLEFNVTHTEGGDNLNIKRLSATKLMVELDDNLIEMHFESPFHKYDYDINNLQRIINNYKKELLEITKEINSIENKNTRKYITLLENHTNISNLLKNSTLKLKNINNKYNASLTRHKIKFEIDLSNENELPDSKITTILRNKLFLYFGSDEYKKEFGVSDKIKNRNKLWNFADYLNNAMLFNIYHLGPNRTHQSRLYLKRNRENEINEIMNFYAHNEPAEGSDIDMFLKGWMRKFDIGDDIKVIDVQATGSYIEIKDGNKKQNLTDKGFGAGQVLTMLMKISNEVQKTRNRSYGKTKISMPTIIIEEPETNLHPDFQSKLAEMFYDAYDKFNMRFILETHSEYLIRKTQTIIKYTQNHNFFKVYYIDKVEGLKEMRYRKDGKFIDEFGSGFFDESTNLTLELF